MNQNLYLASTSPRRIHLLHLYMPEACVLPPQAEEHMPIGLSLEDTVIFLARQKMESVKDQCGNGIIIGVDTVVYNGRIIGKPKDKEEAISILEELRDKEHCIASGVAILNAQTGQVTTFCEKTLIRFGNYSKEEIEAYVATAEPFDKAGGYALNEGWKSHVVEVIGDHENAIGFPWKRIRETLV